MGRECLLLITMLQIYILNCTATTGELSDCEEKCGNTSVPYPFYIYGTSSSCGILPLHCDHRHILRLQLSSGRYKVLGFSRKNVIIIDPEGCEREISRAFTLNSSSHYALSFGNLLMLYGCRNSTSCFNNCNLNITVGLRNVTGCGRPPDCCYDLQFANLPALGQIDLGSLNCSRFSSLVTTFKEQGEDVSVEAKEGLGLEWSLNGFCRTAVNMCAKNAKCVNGTLKGHTCSCLERFAGDPYRAGCRPVNGGKHFKGRIVFAGIVAGATVFAAIVISLALLTRHRRRNTANMRGIRDAKQLAKLLSSCDNAKATLFTYRELERATKNFAASQMLGHGGHGTVYRGKLADGRDVAVKRINHVSSYGIEQVINEVKVLLTVNHPNLVQLLGCCLEVYDPLLVYEFVPNGTLAEHLQHERGEGLDWFTRITIAAEAAQALCYLHSRTPPIYHRDVKSSNILLDNEYIAKVGDFGLSRLVLTEASHISTAPQGTPGYMDPEYHRSFQLSDKSDVYSFGVVLLEIITAMKVVDFTRDKREVNLSSLAISKIATDSLDDIIDPALHSNKNPVIRCMVQRIAELAFRCLAYEKEARPCMLEVYEELEGIKNTCLSPGASPIRDIKIDEGILIPR